MHVAATTNNTGLKCVCAWPAVHKWILIQRTGVFLFRQVQRCNFVDRVNKQKPVSPEGCPLKTNEIICLLPEKLRCSTGLKLDSAQQNSGWPQSLLGRWTGLADVNILCPLCLIIPQSPRSWMQSYKWSRLYICDDNYINGAFEWYHSNSSSLHYHTFSVRQTKKTTTTKCLKKKL